VEYKSNNSRTPLWWAAEKGREAVVKLLLEKGADVESEDRYYGHTPLSRAARGVYEAVVKLLLEKGAEKLLLWKAEKALLIILSSFRILTFVLWWNHMVIPEDHMLVTPS
jgi:ankyrin repeat protein